MAGTASAVGTEILVNTATASNQNAGQVAALANGGFVVTWQDLSQGVGGATGDGTSLAVKAQLFAPDGTPVGAEFLVNTATAGNQQNPQIAALPSGGFVVVWDDASNGIGGATGDSNNTAVKAQLFAADGTPAGSEILVNSATQGVQTMSQIAVLANGGFAVTWQDGSLGIGGATGDGDNTAVKAQLFAADGTRVGSELLVNTATAGNQHNPQIIPLANGGFVATWDDNSLGVGGATGDGDSTAVKAQVFAADGTRVGSELLVNTATESTQRLGHITALANGGFVATWADFSDGVGGATGDDSNGAVKAQVFAADGTRVGSELLVNTATADTQQRGQVTALSNGGFVVAWDDGSLGVGGAAGDDSASAVKAQLFAADGTRVGSELLVNTATASFQIRPQITALANGAFVATWVDFSAGVGGATGDGSAEAVKAQVFAADGTRVGSELLVNTATANSQQVPKVAALPGGGFVVTWLDDSLGVGGATGDSFGQAVKAQVFGVNLAPAIASNGGGDDAAVSLAENLTAVTTVTAADPDPGTTLAFSIVGGADAVRFQIDAATGLLSFVTAPNFEAPFDADLDNGYIVQVRASDGSLSDDQTITVTVTDALEPSPPDGDGNFLFDTHFYLDRNPDVLAAGVNALEHYNVFGFREGRDPNAFFDSFGYLAVNRDVAAAGANPLEHFHQSGWEEGRDPSAVFDTTLYLLRNPDVAAAGVDPLEHFLRFGLGEGRANHAAVGAIFEGFDAQFYLFHNPDVAAAGVDPLAHFDSFGWREGRDPNGWFDTAGYLSHYADVAASGVNPLRHYEQFGWLEGRDPSASFDTLGYLAENPDVAAAGINPLDHFLIFGIYEGRTPVNDGLFH